MKLTFKNLGKIQETTLDLRPLTVIIGPNNTNKTYLAYCVHGLARSMNDWGDILVEPGSFDMSLKLAELVFTVQDFVDYGTPAFASTLAEYFQDTYGGLFKDTGFRIEVNEKDVLAVLARIATDAEFDITLDDSRVIVHDVKRHKQNVLDWLATEVVRQILGSPLTLPAERNALVITYKVLSARRYRILRDSERSRKVRLSQGRAASDRERALLREQGDIRYPAPTEEFLDFLTDVELAASSLNGPKSPFGRLASRIEESIQSGHRTGYEATELGGRELALRVSDTLRIDLYNASSSIKQLAPLLLYLRYRAAEGQMLIIDEPEMNLHPEGQAKLLEALAMLSNLGVHVLLTTHSPYIMAHLNNLVAADATSKPRRARQARHLYMEDAAAFVAPDAVSAYEMRPEGLVTLADPEYGIRWDTLSDVSAELQRRYFAIVEEPERRAKKRRA